MAVSGTLLRLKDFQVHYPNLFVRLTALVGVLIRGEMGFRQSQS